MWFESVAEEITQGRTETLQHQPAQRRVHTAVPGESLSERDIEREREKGEREAGRGRSGEEQGGRHFGYEKEEKM